MAIRPGDPRLPRKLTLPRSATGWILMALMIAGLWAWDQYSTRHPATPKPAGRAESPRHEKSAQPKASTHEKPASRMAPPAGQWQQLTHPRLIDNGGNDGDSFLLGHESGSQRFRLYFVDTPEKSRRYPDRLQHQARYFNNISIDTLTAGGKEAEHFTLDLLKRHKFAAWTKWENVMDSDRFHVLIRFTDMPGEPWLHEQLVKAGLARIYTMPVDLPDGTPKATHVNQLKSLETGARRDHRGLWGK